MATFSGLHSDRIGNLFGMNVTAAGTTSPHSYWQRTAEAAEEIENDNIDFHSDLLKVLNEHTKLLKAVKRNTEALSSGSVADWLDLGMEGLRGRKGKGGRAPRGGSTRVPRSGPHVNVPDARPTNYSGRPPASSRVGHGGVGTPSVSRSGQTSANSMVSRWSRSFQTGVKNTLDGTLSSVSRMGRSLNARVTNYTSLFSSTVLNTTKTALDGLGGAMRGLGDIAKAGGKLAGPLGVALSALDFRAGVIATPERLGQKDAGLMQRVRGGGIGMAEGVFNGIDYIGQGIPRAALAKMGLVDPAGQSARGMERAIGATIGPKAQSEVNRVDQGLWTALTLLPGLMTGQYSTRNVVGSPATSRAAGGRINDFVTRIQRDGLIDTALGSAGAMADMLGGKTVRALPPATWQRLIQQHAAEQASTNATVPATVPGRTATSSAQLAAGQSTNAVLQAGFGSVVGVLGDIYYGTTGVQEALNSMDKTFTEWAKQQLRETADPARWGAQQNYATAIAGGPTRGAPGPSGTIVNGRPMGAGGGTADGNPAAVTTARPSIVPSPGRLSQQAFGDGVANLSTGPLPAGGAFTGSAGRYQTLTTRPTTTATPQAGGSSAMAEVKNLFLKYGADATLADAGTGNFHVESAGLNPLASGDNGSAFGLGQWRNERRANLEAFAKANGLDHRTRETQVRFAMEEMREGSQYADPQSVAFLKRHKAAGARDTATVTQDFMRSFERPHRDYAHLDRRQAAATRSAGLPMDAQGKAVLDPVVARGVTSLLNPDAIDLTAPSLATGRNSDQMGYAGRGSSRGVDPQLTQLMETTLKDFPLRGRIMSGREGRGSGDHAAGRAMDLTLYDQNGVPLPNYQDGTAFRAYELFAQTMKRNAEKMFPNLADGKGQDIQWGGLFGDNGRGGYKYGSNDSMDFRLARGERFRAGSIDSGLNAGYRGWYDRNDVLGGSKPYDPVTYAADMEKLRELRLTPEQKARAEYFGVAQASGNLGPREGGLAPTKVTTTKFGAPGTIHDVQGPMLPARSPSNPELPSQRSRLPTRAAERRINGYNEAKADAYGDGLINREAMTFSSTLKDRQVQADLQQVMGPRQPMGPNRPTGAVKRGLEEQGKVIGKAIASETVAQSGKVKPTKPPSVEPYQEPAQAGKWKRGKPKAPTPANGTDSNNTAAPAPQAKNVPHTDELSMLLATSSMMA